VSGRREVIVRLPGHPGRSYPVRVEPGVIAAGRAWEAALAGVSRGVVIADSNVDPLYGEQVERAVSAATDAPTLRLSFPAGEASKTRESWAMLTDRMLERGVGRDAAVIALGGGVTGDLAGFVAATYMRGIPLVQVPTSLLAMVDASVGGKAAVDVPAGKNLVGAFHQPAAVLADTDTLGTLPEGELRAGLAEAVKHGAIADAEHLAWIEEEAPALLASDGDRLGELVQRSVEIKRDVVIRDEREAGPRQLLNFGHTVAHALEAATGYRMLHGEAVAVGMVAEARIGEQLQVTGEGTADRLAEVLGGLGLPVALPPGMEPEALVSYARRDKKAREGAITCALVSRIGAPAEDWSTTVPEDAFLAALDRTRPGS
jgi:3-dehydroquinate synthase